MLAIGLLGAGRIGRLHAGYIAARHDTRLALVFDESPTAAKLVSDISGAKVCGSAAEIIESSDIDAVFICSPTDTHVDYIIQAAAAGKAIFCEKPIDLDLGRVRQALAALEGSSAPFALGFHRRFDPSHRRLKELVDAGALGRIEQVRFVSRDPAPPPIPYVRRSGGIFRDMAIHDLDQCRYLLGEEFSTVFAQGECLIDRAIGEAGDFDSATILLRAESGASCIIQNARRAPYGFDQRVEIFGSKGSGSIENQPRTTTAVFSAGGRTTDLLTTHFPERYANAYERQLDHFVECVGNETRPLTSAFDGFMALALADAAEQSAASGLPVQPTLNGSQALAEAGVAATAGGRSRATQEMSKGRSEATVLRRAQGGET